MEILSIAPSAICHSPATFFAAAREGNKMNSPFKIPTSCDNQEWRVAQWGERDSDRWPEGFPQPRTCSYCGSAHPEDLMELVKLGWVCEMSTKPYKSYWNPPKGQIGAIPPVKLYNNHVNQEWAEKVNAALRQIEGEDRDV